MKKSVTILIFSLLLISSVSAFSFSDLLKYTGFATKILTYNITCVYSNTTMEGPNVNQTDPFTYANLDLYNSKTKKYSQIKTYVDSCVKKFYTKPKKETKYVVKEAYCVKKTLKTGERRDTIAYKTSKNFAVCESSCVNGACIKNNTFAKALILDAPLPQNLKCFYDTNHEIANLPECVRFYKNQCDSNGNCKKILACPKFYNPVYNSNGTFYPSACWAEQLGVTNYQYGLSKEVRQFISDLVYSRLTDSIDSYHYTVPSPDIEFTYNGGLTYGDGILSGGIFLRSNLWTDNSRFKQMTYWAYSPSSESSQVTFSDYNTLIPVFDTNVRTLMIFVAFDDAYQEEILKNWTHTYERLMNDYLRKKQEGIQPIQYTFIPVVINPPQEVQRFSSSHIFLSEEEMQRIYDAAMVKIGTDNFQAFVTVLIQTDGSFGGYQTSFDNRPASYATLAPQIPKESGYLSELQKGLYSLSAFQYGFLTIHHEILHSLGMSADHTAMGYGTYFLDVLGLNVNHTTGKEITPQIEECDFYSVSPDYYFVELPDNLAITVGQEPSWTERINSSSGPCLQGVSGAMLKDYDRDNKYEIIYKNNIVGVELQRELGWTDIDGDRISELIDTTPYEGYKKVQGRIVDRKTLIGPLGFLPLREETIGNCIFERIRLENQEEGLVPLKCNEFANETVNLYKEIKYNWEKISKDYGNVLLPSLT